MANDPFIRLLQKAAEDASLFEELVKLAARYGIDLTELSEDQLDDVAGGTVSAGTVARTDALMSELADNAKSTYDAAREHFKATLKVLTEHQERQSQVTQKIVS